MFIIKYRKFFIALSALFVVLSIIALVSFGLPLGIDFKGGSELQLAYTDVRPEQSVIMDKLTNAGFGDAKVQSTGDKGIMVKSRDLTDPERVAMVAALTDNGAIAAVPENFTTIGPSVGAELKHKSIISILFVLIAIICFVAYAFRNVSKPVSSWKYGLAVIIALIHDIAIPTGAFALIAHYTGAELDTLFVVALLTTLALSISDTIVVFDRIRETEHTFRKKGSVFIINRAINDMLGRTLITSGTVFVTSLCLYLFAGGIVSDIAFAISIGIFFGTYSSIYVAAPLILIMEKLNLAPSQTAQKA